MKKFFINSVFFLFFTPLGAIVEHLETLELEELTKQEAIWKKKQQEVQKEQERYKRIAQTNEELVKSFKSSFEKGEKTSMYDRHELFTALADAQMYQAREELLKADENLLSKSLEKLQKEKERKAKELAETFELKAAQAEKETIEKPKTRLQFVRNLARKIKNIFLTFFEKIGFYKPRVEMVPEKGQPKELALGYESDLYQGVEAFNKALRNFIAASITGKTYKGIKIEPIKEYASFKDYQEYLKKGQAELLGKAKDTAYADNPFFTIATARNKLIKTYLNWFDDQIKVEVQNAARGILTPEIAKQLNDPKVLGDIVKQMVNAENIKQIINENALYKQIFGSENPYDILGLRRLTAYGEPRIVTRQEIDRAYKKKIALPDSDKKVITQAYNQLYNTDIKAFTDFKLDFINQLENELQETFNQTIADGIAPLVVKAAGGFAR